MSQNNVVKSMIVHVPSLRMSNMVQQEESETSPTEQLTKINTTETNGYIGLYS